MGEIHPSTPSPASISVLMRQVHDEIAAGEAITLEHILYLFGRRGFAFLILILSLLNILIFIVPLISILFGLPMLFLAWQMIAGRPVPIFPKFLLKREINRQAFLSGLKKSIHWLEKIEQRIRPRQLFLTNRYFYRLHGMLAFTLAALVTLPIPVFNALPSTALALLSIGMLQRDGIFILSAYLFGGGALLLFKFIGGHLIHSLAT